MNIAIGGDHAGYQLKTKVIKWLQSLNHVVEDLGPFSDASVDYPDFAHQVAQQVVSKKSDFGIVICGSGNGVNMVVNKYSEIRSALVWTEELAALARQHNNANVLALPARFVSEELALKMVDRFIHTQFEGGRHENRVNKIACA
ncbi:MAG: ribose 5-phosphate isomerase B [Luteibaculaceae bacterium]